jgi:integrase
LASKKSDLTVSRRAIGSVQLRASQLLKDYEYWLNRNYGKTGTYLVNTKTFLKTYKPGGTIISQLDTYLEKKGRTIQTFLRRFRGFLEKKNIQFVINDLNQKKLPRGNIYVKLFLLHRQDRLRGERSPSVYATILNQYFGSIEDNLDDFNKITAERFILNSKLSDYTKRLYKSVLTAFCDWTLLYRDVPGSDLSAAQRQVKKGLRMISAHSLREVRAIKVRSARSQLKTYHKGSLSDSQRTHLLNLCKSQRDRAIISLMAWNGLRTIEVSRLTVSDCMFKSNKVAIWSKGKSARNKDVIKLLNVPYRELKKHIVRKKLKKGKVFADVTRTDIDAMIQKLFRKLKLHLKNDKYSPHSLRHTAGQLMYDKGVKLEFIKKTLRHSIMDTTLVYAQKAIDRNYFRSMPGNV